MPLASVLPVNVSPSTQGIKVIGYFDCREKSLAQDAAVQMDALSGISWKVDQKVRSVVKLRLNRLNSFPKIFWRKEGETPSPVYHLVPGFQKIKWLSWGDPERNYSPINRREFGKYLGGQMDPFHMNVVILKGHAYGYRQVAGTTGSVIRDGLEIAHKISGKKVDVLALLGCFGANYELFVHLGDRAHYAFASPAICYGGGTPLGMVLRYVLDEEGLERDKVMAMLRVPRDTHVLKQNGILHQLNGTNKGGNDLYTIVDLTKMNPLRNSLDALGFELLAMRTREEDVDRFSVASHQSKMPYPDSRGYGDLGDLGLFLHALDEAIHPRSAAHSALLDAKAKLAEAVVDTTATLYFPKASGLNFQRSVHHGIFRRFEKASKRNAAAYESYWGIDTGDSWKRFIQVVSKHSLRRHMLV